MHFLNNQYRQDRQGKQNKTRKNIGETNVPARQTTINLQQAKRNADD